MVIMALQSEASYCRLNKRWEVQELMEGFALGIMGTSASPTNIWTTSLIALGSLIIINYPKNKKFTKKSNSILKMNEQLQGSIELLSRFSGTFCGLIRSAFIVVKATSVQRR